MSSQTSACSRCGGRSMPGHPSYLGSGLCCADQCQRHQVRGYHCIRHIRSLELVPNKVIASRRCAFCNRDAQHLTEARIDVHSYLAPDSNALKSLLPTATMHQDISPTTQPPLPIVPLKKVPGASRKRAARPRGFHRLKKPALNHPFGLHPHRSANELDNVIDLGSDEDLDEPSDTTSTEQFANPVYVPAAKTLPTRSDVCAGASTCLHPPDSSGYCPTHRDLHTQRTPPTSAPVPISKVSAAPTLRCQHPACANLATSANGYCVRHTPQQFHQCSNVFCTQPAIAANGFCVAHASLGAVKTSVKAGSAVCTWQQCHAAAIVGGEGPPRCVLHRVGAMTNGTDKPPSVEAVSRSNGTRNRVGGHGDVGVSHSAPGSGVVKCRAPNCAVSANSNGYCPMHFRTADTTTVVPAMDATPPPNPTVRMPTPAKSAPPPPPAAAQPVDGLASAVTVRRLASLSAPVATCKEDSTPCARMAFFHGYCRAHFSARRCGFSGCNNLRDGVKHCQDHEERPHGDHGDKLKLEDAHCTVAHCTDVATKQGFCAVHVPATTRDLPSTPNSLLKNPAPSVPSASSELEKMPPAAKLAESAIHVSRPSIVAPSENRGAANDSVIPPSSTASPLCQIPHCTHAQKTKGLCRKHYNESLLANSAGVTVPVDVPATAPSHGTSNESTNSSAAPTKTPCKRLGCALSAEAEADFCEAHHRHTDLQNNTTVESGVTVDEPTETSVALTTTTAPTSLADAPSTTPPRQTAAPSNGTTLCKVPSCPLTAKAQGLCRGHALTNQVQVPSAFSTDRPAVVSVLCKAPGCTIAAKLKGYCRKHGNLIELVPTPVESPVDVASDRPNDVKRPGPSRAPYVRCRTHGCRRKVETNGQCSIHCVVPTACSVSGCLFTAQVDGFCDSHYNASH